VSSTRLRPYEIQDALGASATPVLPSSLIKLSGTRKDEVALRQVIGTNSKATWRLPYG
jgi:hypothetical protein